VVFFKLGVFRSGFFVLFVQRGESTKSARSSPVFFRPGFLRSGLLGREYLGEGFC
jgi:hypothetical protein